MSAYAALLGPGAGSVGVGERMGKLKVADLAKSALADATEENKMKEICFSVKVYGLESIDCLSFGDGKADGEDIPRDDNRHHPFLSVFVITRVHSAMINESRCWLAAVERLPRWRKSRRDKAVFSIIAIANREPRRHAKLRYATHFSSLTSYIQPPMMLPSCSVLVLLSSPAAAP